MAAHQVHDLLEEGKQLLGLTDPAADDHDVPRMFGQLRGEGGLGGIIEHDQRHRRVDTALAEPGQLRIESRAESLCVHAGYRLRVITHNQCRRHAGNLPPDGREVGWKS